MTDSQYVDEYVACIAGLLLSGGAILSLLPHHKFAGRIARWSLPRGVQSLEKCYKRRGLCRTQVASISRHISAALNDLSDELVFGQSRRNIVQSGSSLAPGITKRVAVAALLGLEYQRPLAL